MKLITYDRGDGPRAGIVVDEQVLDAATSMSPEAILKLWSPFIPQNPEQFREAFARFFAPPFGPPPSSKG